MAVTSIIVRGRWVPLALRRLVCLLNVMQQLPIWLLNTFVCDFPCPHLNVFRLYRPVAIIHYLMPTVYCHYIRYVQGNVSYGM